MYKNGKLKALYKTEAGEITPQIEKKIVDIYKNVEDIHFKGFSCLGFPIYKVMDRRGNSFCYSYRGKYQDNPKQIYCIHKVSIKTKQPKLKGNGGYL